jgi:choline dehydrogenase-like flavoprotein
VFIDFRQFPTDALITTDLCIIGAGAAGITVAQALADSGLDICLLETGGLEPELQRARLARSDQQSGDYSTALCRLRYFGGITNHWGGYNVPLDEIDFARRDWVAHSGWPIDRAVLEPWYRQANRLLGAGAFAYTRAEMAAADWPYPDLDLQLLDDIYWRLSPQPTEFATGYRDKFRQAANLRVFLYATVTELHADAAARTVTAATIRDIEGNHARITAQRFVIAAGALESARLLLASTDVSPEGLGNAADNVGRYFMMHPHIDIGAAFNIQSEVTRLFTTHRSDGIEIVPGIGPSVASQREHRILNSSVMLQRLANPDSGYAALLKLRDELKRLYFGWKIGVEDLEAEVDIKALAWAALTDIDSVVAGLWQRSQDDAYVGESAADAANIYVQSEQAPNPDSRITLTAERDALGMRQMKVDCRVLPIDKQTLRVMGELIGRELGMRNGGRVQLLDWLLDPDVSWDSEIWGGCHHMGTTRMSANPANGVVDADCRVHGLDNTYIASSSVFTTSGHANPTITIVALALRLAEHLRTRPPAGPATVSSSTAPA